MLLRNFELMNIDLAVGESIYDLHNDFSFAGFAYDLPTRELELRWLKGTGDWVSKESPSEIRITICGVSYLAVLPRDPDMPYTEDDCLNCVSVVEASQPTESAFITAATPENDLHYVFRFMSGFVLRVQAQEATCSTA